MKEITHWTHEFRHAFKNLNDLYYYLQWDLPSEFLKVEEKYPLFVPRGLAKKIKKEGPNGVLAKEFLPAAQEMSSNGLKDPIGDKTYLRAPQLIHRYPSRALFTPTTICPVHCRYCFRKNELSPEDEIFQHDFKQTLSYLKDHPEITEIIFTGGDPLTLSTPKIATYLEAFSQIDSLKDIRFHTRYPVIFPERIDDEFIELIKKYSHKFRTFSIGIHTNHKNEFDASSIAAMEKLSRLRVQLLSQTVLLKGINDCSETLIELFNQLLDLKVRPYYLHHPDRVKGAMHFYLTLEEGRKIYQKLRKFLPGWALPHYVIDVPGGHGKISAYNPETTSYSGKLITLGGYPISIQEIDHY